MMLSKKEEVQIFNLFVDISSAIWKWYDENEKSGEDYSEALNNRRTSFGDLLEKRVNSLLKELHEKIEENEEEIH